MDAVALALFGLAIAALYSRGSSLSWILAIVAGHFFLFCNVFRVARKRELMWAVAFVLNVACWLVLDRLNWSNALCSQLPVTIGLIGWEMKAASYHGVFADRVNSRLAEYIEGTLS
jgi:hypothetical protein